MRSPVNLRIDKTLADRARDIVAASESLTLTALLESGLRLAVERHERAHGRAPKRRRSLLRAGRKPSGS